MNDEVFSKLTASNKKMRQMVALIKDKNGELDELREEMEKNSSKSFPFFAVFLQMAFRVFLIRVFFSSPFLSFSAALAEAKKTLAESSNAPLLREENL